MSRARATVGFVLVAACSPAPPPHFEESAPPSVFTESPVTDVPANERGIRRGECPAEIAEYPIPYFEDRVLVRLPIGLSEDTFIEYTPNAFARSITPVESSNCHEGMPGPLIYFAALTMFAEKPTADRTLEQIRDNTVEAFGYPETSVIVEQDYDPSERAGIWVYEVPAEPDIGRPEPAKVLVTLRVAEGLTVALVLEVHPSTWSVIVDSLVASAESLRVLPP